MERGASSPQPNSDMPAGHAPPPMSEVTDEDLVRQTLAGKRQSFDALVRRHQRSVYGIAYRTLSNSHDAQEVTQNAFINAFEKLSTLGDPAAFAGWVKRIVNNLALNFRRSRALRKTMSIDYSADADGSDESTALAATMPDSLPGPEQSAHGKELGSLLAAALDQLPPKQRAALEMFTVDGMSQQEIADKLHMSLPAVKWNVFSARKTLKQLLDQNPPPDQPPSPQNQS